MSNPMPCSNCCSDVNCKAVLPEFYHFDTRHDDPKGHVVAAKTLTLASCQHDIEKVPKASSQAVG
jgi:hypothetical protein